MDLLFPERYEQDESSHEPEAFNMYYAECFRTMKSLHYSGSGAYPEGSAAKWPYVAKVSDFGLSVKVDEFFGHVSNAHHGTPFYMAPEVTRAGFLSMAADSYSFGVATARMVFLF